MEAHTADHRAFVTDNAPGAQTGRMSFSALRFAGKRVVDFDESSREIFAAATSMRTLLASSKQCPGRSSPWTNYRLVVDCKERGRNRGNRIKVHEICRCHRSSSMSGRRVCEERRGKLDFRDEICAERQRKIPKRTTFEKFVNTKTC